MQYYLKMFWLFQVISVSFIPDLLVNLDWGKCNQLESPILNHTRTHPFSSYDHLNHNHGFFQTCWLSLISQRIITNNWFVDVHVSMISSSCKTFTRQDVFIQVSNLSCHETKISVSIRTFQNLGWHFEA